MKKIAITIISLFVLSVSAFAQRFSVGTNAVDLLSLGTLEAEASVAVSQHWSFHVGAELNPWTWNAGDQKTQLQSRQNSYWGGARYWPWHVYSGWWWGADARYSVYNVGGIIKRDTQEGDAYGVGEPRSWCRTLGRLDQLHSLRLPSVRDEGGGRDEAVHPPGCPYSYPADFLNLDVRR